ncbi:hypothetical protein BKA62DRAFT_679212 [Auriculariales sp. MPI-PUGE-AT-0066]|nr:hypothetical protein BKA62DRAFT_679212 [Auriculariales sp. MPI-PUGE-AT-0066]
MTAPPFVWGSFTSPRLAPSHSEAPSVLGGLTPVHVAHNTSCHAAQPVPVIVSPKPAPVVASRASLKLKLASLKLAIAAGSHQPAPAIVSHQPAPADVSLKPVPVVVLPKPTPAVTPLKSVSPIASPKPVQPVTISDTTLPGHPFIIEVLIYSLIYSLLSLIDILVGTLRSIQIFLVRFLPIWTIIIVVLVAYQLSATRSHPVKLDEVYSTVLEDYEEVFICSSCPTCGWGNNSGQQLTNARRLAVPPICTSVRRCAGCTMTDTRTPVAQRHGASDKATNYLVPRLDLLNRNVGHLVVLEVKQTAQVNISDHLEGVARVGIVCNASGIVGRRTVCSSEQAAFRLCQLENALRGLAVYLHFDVLRTSPQMRRVALEKLSALGYNYPVFDRLVQEGEKKPLDTTGPASTRSETPYRSSDNDPIKTSSDDDDDKVPARKVKHDDSDYVVSESDADVVSEMLDCNNFIPFLSNGHVLDSVTELGTTVATAAVFAANIYIGLNTRYRLLHRDRRQRYWLDETSGATAWAGGYHCEQRTRKPILAQDTAKPMSTPQMLTDLNEFLSAPSQACIKPAQITLWNDGVYFASGKRLQQAQIMLNDSGMQCTWAYAGGCMPWLGVICREDTWTTTTVACSCTQPQTVMGVLVKHWLAKIWGKTGTMSPRCHALMKGSRQAMTKLHQMTYVTSAVLSTGEFAQLMRSVPADAPPCELLLGDGISALLAHPGSSSGSFLLVDAAERHPDGIISQSKCNADWSDVVLTKPDGIVVFHL